MTYLTIALIVSVAITILGGIVLTISYFFEYLKPLGYTLLALGGVATFLVGYVWISGCVLMG